MPIGEKLWEQKSSVAARRICDCSEKGIHTEVSFVGEIKGYGRLAGKEGKIVGTDNYWERVQGLDVVEGTACGLVTFRGGEMFAFKACGISKPVRHSPKAPSVILSLLQLIDPPPELNWMRNTLVIWEGVVDERTMTVTATAHEWTAPGARL